MVKQAMPYKILAFGHTDKGLVRQNNEDVWGEVAELGLFVLADGMGGHRAGEVAAREAVAVLCRLVRKALEQKETPSIQEMVYILERSIEQVNSAVYKLGRSDDQLRGMGTTICCLQFHREGAIYAHVGDSRIYRLRAKKLEQLTSDHSLLRELIDLGQINEDESSEFLYKNIITKAIGTEPTVEPSIHVCDIADGDLFLMCTDGLSDLLTKDDMEAIINRAPTIRDAGKTLVACAKERGGYDNITIVIMQVQEVNEKKQDLSR